MSQGRHQQLARRQRLKRRRRAFRQWLWNRMTDHYKASYGLLCDVVPPLALFPVTLVNTKPAYSCRFVIDDPGPRS